MLTVTDRHSIKTVQSTFTTLGVKPPKALTVAFEQAEIVAGKAPHLGAGHDLTSSVLDAILGDREPAEDPAVQAALAAQTLAGHRQLDDALTAAVNEGIRSACAAHLDTIVTGWRKHFDTAAATLTAAHQRIGNLPLEDTTPILAKGGDIADVWARAQAAQRTIDTVLEGWVNLMRLLHINPNPQHRPLKLAALTYEQWRELPAKLTAWEALCEGLTLSLPTLEEYRTRVAALNQAEAQPESVVDRARSAVAGREIRVPVA